MKFLKLLPLFLLIGFSVVKADEQVFCPPVVSCFGHTCEYDKDFSKYVGLEGGDGHDLKLDKVTAYHNKKYDNHYDYYQEEICWYGKYFDDKNNEVFHAGLEIKPEASLEADFLSGTNWVIDKKSEMLDEAWCYPRNGSAESCPLKKINALVIKRKDLRYALQVKINNSNDSVTNEYRGDTGLYATITHDAALKYCTKPQCEIEISNNNGLLGTVIIDMDNNMKILKYESVDNTIVVLKRIQGFNAISVEYPEGVKKI